MKLRTIAGGVLAFAALAIVGVVDAGTIRRRDANLAARAPAEQLPLYLSDPDFSGALRLAVMPTHSQHMWVEPLDGVARNHPNADGDLVGQIDDPSWPGAHTIQWTSTARSGVLRTEAATGRSYVELVGATANTTDIAVVANSRSASRFCHGPAQGGARACTVVYLAGMQAGTDGAQQVLVDNFRGTGTNIGWSLYRTATNRVQWLVAGGAGAVCNHTTSASASLIAANGIVPIVVRVAGNAVEINVGSATEEGFTCTGAGSSADSTDNITIGGSSAGSGTGSHNFGGMLVFNQRFSDADTTELVAALMAVSGRSAMSLKREMTPEQGYYSGLSDWFDFTRADCNWQDAAATTPVASVGQEIRASRSPLDLANLLNRGATSTVTNPPLWRGPDGAEWSGTAPQSLVWSAWPTRGGAMTVVVEMEQDRTTFGSHWCEGSGYGTATGSDYVDNPGGLAYWVIHSSSGGGATAPLRDDGVGWQVLEAVRDGSSWTGTTYGAGSNTVSNSNAFYCGSIGRENVPGTRMDGRIRRLMKWNVTLTPAEIARITNDLQ